MSQQTDQPDFLESNYSDDDGRTPLAYGLGLGAALIAGGIWAAVVRLTGYEVGYVAWGVGLLVGWAMARATSRRSRSLAYAAAAFALVGLIAGKLFIFMGSAGAIAKEWRDDHESRAGSLAWHFYEDRALETPTLDAVDSTFAANDTLSDLLWADMREQANQRFASLPAEQQDSLLNVAAAGLVANIGPVSGVMGQLSPFDVLWLFLALGTAYGMMNQPKQATAPVPEEQQPA